MDLFGYLDVQRGLMLTLTAFLTASAALWLVARLTPARRIVWDPLGKAGDETAFLFRDTTLVDATPDAHALLGHGPEPMEDFPRLMALLSPRFPDLGERLSALGQVASLEIPATDGQSVLAAEWRAGLARIALRPAHGRRATAADGLSLAALEDELSDLRATVDAAPVLIWKEDAAGAVRWANAAYLELALVREPGRETLSWPLPRLFESSEGADGRLTLDLPAKDGRGTVSRIFSAERKRLGGTTMVFATPADSLARAETQHREFIQTLTKTFAHLPIGLALFDRDRRLAVFNPALTDLSALPPLFLSRRPTLFDFLDALREARRMPEPKDYREWRRRIVEMEEAAAHGTHIETWTLPEGQTFRVTGRPHPDGAIAFLFQDITSETSIARRYRSDLEMGHSVLDSLDEAIAVFGPSRALLLSNAAYEALWDDESGATLAPATLADAMDRWRSVGTPSPVWDDIAAFTACVGPREGWRREIRLADGRGLMCRVAPLPGAATLVGFAPLPAGAVRLARVEAASAPSDAARTAGDLPPTAAST